MTGSGWPSEHSLWASYNTDVWNKKKKLLHKGQRFKQKATTTETDTIFQNKNKKSRQNKEQLLDSGGRGSTYMLPALQNDTFSGPFNITLPRTIRPLPWYLTR